MPSEVTRSVDTGQPYPVLRLAGVLDAGSAPAVRSALIDILAGQPEAVVVDVSGLRAEAPGAVAVLRDLAHDTADWPAARLVLCAADPAPWRDTGLPVAADVETAVTGLGRSSGDRRYALDLQPVVGAARRSRELLTEACDRWGTPGLAGSGSIVVTEMVNNVVAHARTPMTVLLALRQRALSVAVRDHSTAQPDYTGEPVAPTSYGGRGLLLIDSVAERWGNLALDDGKVVWALLSTEPDDDGTEQSDGTAQSGSTARFDGAGMTGPARG